MSKVDALKRIAFKNVTKKIETYEDFEEAICGWWRRKYKIPDTDPRYLEKYVDDMIVEYFEDQFSNDPELLQAYRRGFDNTEDMEKDRLKEIMGENYTEEISYLQEPTEVEKKTKLPISDNPAVLGEENSEEVIMEFSE